MHTKVSVVPVLVLPRIGQNNALFRFHSRKVLLNSIQFTFSTSVSCMFIKTVKSYTLPFPNTVSFSISFIMVQLFLIDFV